MASLKYVNGPSDEFAAKTSAQIGYSQAVIIPLSSTTKIIKLSGQGGWGSDGKISSDKSTQVEQTFKNIEVLLKEAGARGWEDVYQVRSFHTELGVTLGLAVELTKRYVPHKPVWTAVGTNALAFEGMEVEIEVEAIISS